MFLLKEEDSSVECHGQGARGQESLSCFCEDHRQQDKKATVNSLVCSEMGYPVPRLGPPTNMVEALVVTK